MKTTRDINDSLLAKANALALQQCTSLTQVVEDGLRLRLRLRLREHVSVLCGVPRRSRQRLPVFNGPGGLCKGADPLSNKALHAALENSTAA